MAKTSNFPLEWDLCTNILSPFLIKGVGGINDRFLRSRMNDSFPQRGMNVWETFKGENHEVGGLQGFQGRAPRQRMGARPISARQNESLANFQGRKPRQRMGGLLLILLLILCTLSVAEGQAQTNSLQLPLTTQLETSLRTFYEDERDAQLAAFNTKTTGAWKDLLPSVGLTYTLSNQPRPTLSWSPISILNRQDAKRKEVLSKKSLVRTYDVIISDHLFKLHQLISTYFIDLEALQAKSAALQLDELLFDIVEERYKENLIKPTEYIREQKKILIAREVVNSYKQQLLKKRAEIIYTAKYNEPATSS